MIELNMLRKIAWSYAKNNPGLDFDDLFSETCLACLEAMPRYDQNKSSKNTFFYYVAQNHLNNLLKRHKTNKEIATEYNEFTKYTDTEPTPEQHVIAKERWEESLMQLSPEAIEVWTILNTETTLPPITKPKICKSAIIQILKTRGWGQHAISKTFRELKTATTICA